MEKRAVVAKTGGERCDKYIASKMEGVSRSYLKRLFDEGKISVNGKPVPASYKLRAGDRIEAEIPDAKEIDAKPEDITLDVVYEDEDVLVINKPRGMVVHPAPGNETGTVVNAALSHCKGSLSGINGAIRPGIVHRIDKDTTGLLIIAKNDAAHMKLSEALSDRSLSRKYFALVHGNIKEDSGTVSAPIARSEKDRKMMAVAKKGGREAVTDFEVIERFSDYTLLLCSLRTGRTHQIRVHMKHIGHPIVGDKTYGVKKEEFSLSGQLLHAGRLDFIHPKDGEKISVTSPLPDDFEKVLGILRRRKND